MHNQNQRCTVLFENQDWFTFKLEQDKAVRILHHQKMMDATLLRHSDDKLSMVGYLRKMNLKNRV